MAASITQDSATGAGSLASLLQSFAFAADLAFGVSLEDGMRACFISMRIADELAISPDERITVYYAALLKDAGCTCQTTQLATAWRTDEIAARRESFIAESNGIRGFAGWLRTYPAAGAPAPLRLKTILSAILQSGSTASEALSSATTVCSRICARLGLPESVQRAAESFFEQWDGKGVPGLLRREEIPLASRVILPTFVIPLLLPTFSREDIRKTVRSARGKAFDPRVVDAFLSLSEKSEFWQELEDPGIAARVLAMEPSSPIARAGDSTLDDVAMAFADFIDLKSPFTSAHSRRVARLAEAIARHLGCTEPEQATARRAALMHDIGLVAIPSFVLNRPNSALSESEREQLRLHPYFGERILERVPAMAEITPVVGAHHERVDGTGYFRGLKQREIPLGARICAAADRLDELTHDLPGQPALPLGDALKVLGSEAGSSLDAEIVNLVQGAMGLTEEPVRPRRWPAGLTDREVEVLRLAARGHTRREIGTRLAITENTVRHHLEHVYNKTSTSARVGAVLFAIENGLLD